MRTTSKLTLTTLTALALATVAAHAQQASSAKCGIETWSTDKMAYVSMPCADDPQAGATATPVAAGTAAYCTALVRAYDQYLNRDSRLGGPSLSLESRAGAEKCRAGDTAGIPALEKALRDARIDLPKHS